MLNLDQYHTYLKRFLSEGDKYNGTNIWLGNLLHYSCRPLSSDDKVINSDVKNGN